MQLKEKQSQQIRIQQYLKDDHGLLSATVLLGNNFLAHRLAPDWRCLLLSVISDRLAPSRHAAAISLSPSVTAPSLLSGARMQTSAASSSSAPAAIILAAVTSARVEGGSKWKTSSALRILVAHCTSRFATDMSTPASDTSTSASRSGGRKFIATVTKRCRNDGFSSFNELL